MKLDWHGHAHCHDCDWSWDLANHVDAINQEREAGRHERQTGHSTSTRLHRTDHCTSECHAVTLGVRDGSEEAGP